MWNQDQKLSFLGLNLHQMRNDMLSEPRLETFWIWNMKNSKICKKNETWPEKCSILGLKTWGCLPPRPWSAPGWSLQTCSHLFIWGLTPPPPRATSDGGNRNWSTHGFQAGDMHPAGMQSCFYTFVVFTVVASRVHWHHPLSRTRVDTSRFIIMLIVLPSVGKHL